MFSETIIISAIGVFGTLFGVYLGYSLPKKDRLKDEIYAPLVSNLMNIENGLNQIDLKKLKLVSWEKIHKESKSHNISNSLRHKLGHYSVELHNYGVSLNARINMINEFSEKELMKLKISDKNSYLPHDVKCIGRYVLSVLDGGNNVIWEISKLKVPYNDMKKDFNLKHIENPEDFVKFIAKKIKNKEYPSNIFILGHIKYRNKMILFTRELQEIIESELNMFPKLTRFKNRLVKFVSKPATFFGYYRFGNEWIRFKRKNKKQKN
ncbi:MAG: hypothetical protein KAS90_05260 [Candidatus Aenigmarchaeota archaeon]|nr:hypothetical protein [Candidatus Aenigmarchaeota archaeon]